MKETILDVLMYMFQSYVEDNDEVEFDKELHKTYLRQDLLIIILKEHLSG